MSICVYCGKRKGKRSCPVLKGMICSQCCGEKRIKTIPCPENCSFLSTHMIYTKEKKVEKFAVEWVENFKDLDRESLSILAGIEFLIYSYLYDFPSTLDIEIISGMEYTRRRFSPIVIPGEVRNIFGENLQEFLNMGIKEGSIDRNRILAVLDRLINFVKKVNGAKLQSNEFVKGFLSYMEKYSPEKVSLVKGRKKSSILEIG
ncbi:MAG: hypothetical protein ACUVUG_05725 [Candidatus Aminicenantia bacterium]